jgi:hypothetical protein
MGQSGHSETYTICPLSGGQSRHQPAPEAEPVSAAMPVSSNASRASNGAPHKPAPNLFQNVTEKDGASVRSEFHAAALYDDKVRAAAGTWAWT